MKETEDKLVENANHVDVTKLLSCNVTIFTI